MERKDMLQAARKTRTTADSLVELLSPSSSSETHTGTSSERRLSSLPRVSLPDRSSTVERRLL
jgi:hypothetical protein